MHDDRMNTGQTCVYSLPVNLSRKRTVPHFRCCNMLHIKSPARCWPGWRADRPAGFTARGDWQGGQFAPAVVRGGPVRAFDRAKGVNLPGAPPARRRASQRDRASPCGPAAKPPPLRCGLPVAVDCSRAGPTPPEAAPGASHGEPMGGCGPAGARAATVGAVGARRTPEPPDHTPPTAFRGTPPVRHCGKSKVRRVRIHVVHHFSSGCPAGFILRKTAVNSGRGASYSPL